MVKISLIALLFIAGLDAQASTLTRCSKQNEIYDSSRFVSMAAYQFSQAAKRSADQWFIVKVDAYAKDADQFSRDLIQDHTCNEIKQLSQFVLNSYQEMEFEWQRTATHPFELEAKHDRNQLDFEKLKELLGAADFPKAY